MTEKKTIEVAVAAHKYYRMPSDPTYLPLLVGAALQSESVLGTENWSRDDTGNSISELNPYYSELTGLWWMWKNSLASVKGIVHYRRYLGSPHLYKRFSFNRMERIATGNDLISSVKCGDGVVLAKKRHYGIETVYSHYAHTFEAEQFDVCRDVLTKMEPDYVQAWDRLMQSRSAHLFNIFVMRSDIFNDYCSWIFPILFELENRLNPKKYGPFGARYLGRVSERLLDPWLETNRIHSTELPVVSPEPVNWVAKGSGFLKAKFLGRKYTRSF